MGESNRGKTGTSVIEQQYKGKIFTYLEVNEIVLFALLGGRECCPHQLAILVQGLPIFLPKASDYMLVT